MLLAIATASASIVLHANFMSSTLGLLLLGSLLVAGMATAVLAASPGNGVSDFVGVGSQSGNGHAWGFADTNSDMVNDNFVDADDDGTCDNFVDEDEDGINDLPGTRGIGGQGRTSPPNQNRGRPPNGTSAGLNGMMPIGPAAARSLDPELAAGLPTWNIEAAGQKDSTRQSRVANHRGPSVRRPSSFPVPPMTRRLGTSR
jgi:hypothetical protein